MSLAKQARRNAQKAAVRARFDNLDRHDQLSTIRRNVSRMADERNDWSGCPMPIDNLKLTIEPTFKYAALSQIGREDEVKDEDSDCKVRNIFWSRRKGCRVAICEWPEGKFWAAPLVGSSHGLTALIHTIGASEVWGIEQEANALQLLATLLRHHQYKQYLLTGAFLETSERSGVTYVFRKLRPTVALKGAETVSVLCTLCMHPIGYYEESWAGCMCPTDDLIAHLTLMRGDEKMFWRRCNQHAPHDPSGGL